MHILIFVDQHMDSLGGAQGSVRLQKKYLERAGHVVSVCSPASSRASKADESIIPRSYALTPNGEFQLFIPGFKTLAALEGALANRSPVDVVHIQADFWGASLGFAYAKKHELPCVITFHSNIGVGLKKVLGGPVASLVIWLASMNLRRMLPRATLRLQSGPWRYLAQLGALADVRLAPTDHFANTLQEHGVRDVASMSNGIDDDVLDAIKSQPPNDRIEFIWTGRFSGEKRPIEFLEAVQLANIPATVHMYGGGPLAKRVANFVKTNKITNVVVHDRLAYQQVLEKVAASHVYVQTSIGYETQGMGVFEALTLGTPVILCDPAIASSFPVRTYWQVADSSIEALAHTLAQAYSDVLSGKRGRVQLGDDYNFRQSTATERAIALYRSLLPRINKH